MIRARVRARVRARARIARVMVRVRIARVGVRVTVRARVRVRVGLQDRELAQAAAQLQHVRGRPHLLDRHVLAARVLGHADLLRARARARAKVSELIWARARVMAGRRTRTGVRLAAQTRP